MRTPQLSSDIFILATISGFIAKVVHDLLGMLVISFVPTFPNCVRIAGGLALTKEQVWNASAGAMLLGFQIDLIVGISIALVTVIALRQWGTDHYALKGAMVGLVAWALFYNVLSRLLSRVYPAGSIKNAELSFLTHIAFGVTLTASIIWVDKMLQRRSRKHSSSCP